MVPGVVRYFISCSSSSLGDELIPLFPSVPSPRVGTRKFKKKQRGGGGGGGGGVGGWGCVCFFLWAGLFNHGRNHPICFKSSLEFPCSKLPSIHWVVILHLSTR